MNTKQQELLDNVAFYGKKWFISSELRYAIIALIDSNRGLYRANGNQEKLIKGFSHEKKQLRDEVAHLVQEQSQLQADLAAAKSVAENLNSWYETEYAKVDNLRQAGDLARKELEQATQKLKDLGERHAHMVKERGEALKAREDLEIEVANLRQQLAEETAASVSAQAALHQIREIANAATKPSPDDDLPF